MDLRGIVVGAVEMWKIPLSLRKKIRQPTTRWSFRQAQVHEADLRCEELVTYTYVRVLHQCFLHSYS